MCVIDVLEDKLPIKILKELLIDHTTGKNIFWASSDYITLGKGFDFTDSIEIASIIGNNGHIIMPRVVKSKELKKKRTIDKAEIFTPAWVCNDMCNAGDENYLSNNTPLILM